MTRAGLAVAALVAVIGLWKASFVAGATDAFGYVSEADLIAHGRLSIDQQFVRTLPWPFADWSFAPAGYRPGVQRGVIVPTYPAGVPLIMALFQRLGGRTAVFYVVPILGGVCVWVAGMLARDLQHDAAGLAVAALLATSPIFLVELMAPASDVAATCWWTIAFATAVRLTTISAVTSGLAAAMAVLTRPNLVLLDAAIAVFLAARAAAAPAAGRRQSVRRLLAFVAFAAMGCAVVAGLNTVLYGAPLRSGYETLDALFAWSNARANLARYPRWLMQTQTPFIATGLIAPWIVPAQMGRARDRTPVLWLLIAWVAVVCGSYLFYRPFGADEWTYLRFLLPAYPALLTLTVVTVFVGLRRLVADSRRATALAIALCAIVAGWQLRKSIALGVFAARTIERRYVDVGHYVQTMLPLDTICIARLHAGSLRYYGERTTLYYDWLQPGWLDAAVRELGARGYHPVIVVERDEEPGFRARFGAFNALGRLDWPPSAELASPVDVRIYDPAERRRFLDGDRIATRAIEPWQRFR